MQVKKVGFLLKCSRFVHHNFVLAISVCAAVFTMFFVPPDQKYFNYFDFRTLTCMFCVLAVVGALRNIEFFSILARQTVKHFRTARSSILALVYITFISSMLIENDMALLTFLPLGYFILSSTNKKKYLAFTFILQNMAANLGGMVTPFGNPQNLYLFSKYNIPTARFFVIMFPPFLVSMVLITVCCFFVKEEPLSIEGEEIKLPLKRTAIYALLFLLSVSIVFRWIPYLIGLVVLTAVLYVADKKSLKMVDYPLLMTFVAFFIFSGNMARIEFVRNLFRSALHTNALLVSVLSCQVISNVPTAILLSQFTNQYKDILIGVNIGGAGTLIASLASLITYREFVLHSPENSKSYFKLFSLLNFAFLFVLYVFSSTFH